MALITIIMPVYNGGKYLVPAVESMLNQTFSDFELMLIDDASTDSSVEILKSFHDPRIRLILHPKNMGLIATLNQAIDLVQTEFVARMDCDDISEPQRLEIQLKYLLNHKTAQMVCSPILGITPQNKPRGHWPADIESRTFEEIKKRLSHENCIAHPTVLIRTAVLKKYRYSKNQAGSEDWDLWLRLCRDNVRIIKTEEVLLKYRIHPGSTTVRHKRNQAVQIKTALVKLRFFLGSLKNLKLRPYVFVALFSAFRDLAYYYKTEGLPQLLRNIRWCFTISPFKAARQYKKIRETLDSKKSRHFFFFPYSHLGGAEKVHARITRLATAVDPFVFITGIDNHHPMPEQFGNPENVLHAGACLYHPFFAKRSEKFILQKIMNTTDTVLFGCNNRFYDHILPLVPATAFAVDLTHDYDYAGNRDYAEKHLQAYLRNNFRVFISKAALDKTRKFYEDNYVDPAETDKLKLILNGTETPLVKPNKIWQAPWRMLYVGRDTSEKRVQLLFDLAKVAAEKKLPFEFVFIGPIKHREGTGVNVHLTGSINDPAALSGEYARAHFILISSVSEGFPLSIMEGMMHACIPVSTAVGDIPNHISNKQNGLLVMEGSYQEILKEFENLLIQISSGNYALAELSGNAERYARQNFSIREFEKAYRDLLRL